MKVPTILSYLFFAGLYASRTSPTCGAFQLEIMLRPHFLFFDQAICCNRNQRFYLDSIQNSVALSFYLVDD